VPNNLTTSDKVLVLAELLDNPPPEMTGWEFEFIEQHSITLEELDKDLREHLNYTIAVEAKIDELYDKFNTLGGPNSYTTSRSKGW